MDPANWTNGAPAAGYTVILSVAPPNGPEVATNDAIVGQSITLSNGASFYATGTSSFDANDNVY